jgi:hypothetical protein
MDRFLARNGHPCQGRRTPALPRPGRREALHHLPLLQRALETTYSPPFLKRTGAQRIISGAPFCFPSWTRGIGHALQAGHRVDIDHVNAGLMVG